LNVFVSERKRMERVCCILDSDEKFAVRMCACLNKKHIFPFDVQAFSKIEEYLSCAASSTVELLLVDEHLYDEVRNVPAQQIIRLCEQPVLMEGETDACVAKFQAGDELVRDVLYMYNGQLLPERRGMENTNCKMVCVYSPNGYCGKTTLAMTLAHIKGEKKRTLYLNLEEFSGMELPEENGTISDALYYYRTLGVAAGAKLLSVIGHANGFDYIAPAVCVKDIAQTDTDELITFIDNVALVGEYELIVVDIGCLVKEPWKLLERSDLILCPSPDSRHRKRRQEEFEKYMYMAEYKNVIDKLKKVDIVYDNAIYRDGQLNYAYIRTSRYAGMVMDIDI